VSSPAVHHQATSTRHGCANTRFAGNLCLALALPNRSAAALLQLGIGRGHGHGVWKAERQRFGSGCSRPEAR